METKFTKGEWFAVDYAGRFVIQKGPNYSDADILSYDDFDGEEFCVSEEEALANAKLIKAAPDLINEHEKLISAIESLFYWMNHYSNLSMKQEKQAFKRVMEQIENSKSAIKKATE